MAPDDNFLPTRGSMCPMYLVNMEISCLTTICTSSIHHTLQVLMGPFNHLITPFPHYDFIIKMLQVAFNQFFLLICLISIMNGY